ncbi:MAG TPA: hypothetical protein VFM88_18305 [Vicinamibacteria bacterium]|nr:hypothetical protein [Vicinamibacteria bacterium]
MSLTVAERAHRIGTFRWVEVRLMEIAAAWTPTTPEMEVKVMFGRHIWDFAQHADALGRRMFELRRPAQESVPPAQAYVRLLDEIRELEGTVERLAALYDGLLPGIERRYERYRSEVDAVLDAPSLVVVERILADARRQRDEARALRREIALPGATAEPLAARERGLELIAPPA